LRFFSVSGIRIEIHRSFWALPILLSVWTARESGLDSGVRMFALVLCVFLCVLGHELTHSLRALKFGIRTPVITLYPMGGVASMERIPREPWREFSIAAVGPLFNFALAALLYFPMRAWLGNDLFSPGLESWPRVAANVFWVNPVLGAFNLIPAFPMDGGRMLRALLSFKMKYASATRVAVILGCFFAIIFVILGVWKKYWMLGLVGLYVFFAALKELRQASGDNERT